MVSGMEERNCAITCPVLGKIQRPYSRKELCLLVWKGVGKLPAVEENAFKTHVLVFLSVFKVD